MGGDDEPQSCAHLNLLIGHIIVHHPRGVCSVILGGAGPPAQGEVGSSFPEHPHQPLREPLPASHSPALPHPSSALMKPFQLPILPKGTTPGALTVPEIPATNPSPACARSRAPTGPRIPVPSPAPSPWHGRSSALQVGVSHGRHDVGNSLHIHIVVVQSLWGCLRACFHQEETQPAAQVFRAACLEDKGRVGVHAQLPAPLPCCFLIPLYAQSSRVAAPKSLLSFPGEDQTSHCLHGMLIIPRIAPCPSVTL